jgi:hypothetical protein
MEINPLTHKPRQYLLDFSVPENHVVCCYCDELIKKRSLYSHKYTIRHINNKKILDIQPAFLKYKKPVSMANCLAIILK